MYKKLFFNLFQWEKVFEIEQETMKNIATRLEKSLKNLFSCFAEMFFFEIVTARMNTWTEKFLFSLFTRFLQQQYVLFGKLIYYILFNIYIWYNLFAVYFVYYLI